MIINSTNSFVIFSNINKNTLQTVLSGILIVQNKHIQKRDYNYFHERV